MSAGTTYTVTIMRPLIETMEIYVGEFDTIIEAVREVYPDVMQVIEYKLKSYDE